MAGSICIDDRYRAMTTPYHPPVKYSVTINGHQTSISLEPMFWEMLRAAAEVRGKAVNLLVAEIDAERIKSATPPGLAGAIRIWLVTNMQSGQ
jgi:predicted DNA-binding ribbon-helix-helix protein